MSKAGVDTEVIVALDQKREAHRKIQRWYQQSKGHPTPPTREGMDNTSILKENLYMWCSLEVEAILAQLQLEMIADDTLEGEDITMAVWRQQMGRAVGPSGIDVNYRVITLFSPW